MEIGLLHLRHQNHGPLVCNLLRDPHVIRMKMRDQHVIDRLYRNADLSKRPAKGGKCPRPAGVKEQISFFPFDQICICIGIMQFTYYHGT